MKLHLTDAGGIHSVRGYRPDSVVVDDTTYFQSLIVSPTDLLVPWSHPAPTILSRQHIAPAMGLDPEVILLGTGQRLVFPEFAVIAAHQVRGVGFEVMDTAAACRTFNILAADGRRVVAALMLGC